MKQLKYLIGLLLSLAIAITLVVPSATATGVYDLPVLSAGSSTWVVDQANTISLSNENELSNQLSKLAENTGKEVRLIAVRRLDYDTTIKSLADDIFSKWYPTPEAQANQIILVVDTFTNNTALRQGDATKSLLTDDIATSIVKETVAFPLRDGAKYNQAFLDASDRLVAVLSGDPDPGPPATQEINIESTFTSAEDTDDANATTWVIVLLVLATAIPMATYFWYVGLPGR
ncbi:photosystem II repair protein Psb32 [Crocosphaera sp. XPORK-15E]|uniref:photosystem II repair protein Psb32 n=1 Tax=Crocosphaera sp. XPORK-15E TaxID=3110247 RepID=UPI002B1F323E|nr:TPM domain-containing protein [Crocosphaera sp. XPORK-15E]MEA5533194.1 TPM domain-containing protein [Crocosphaera sp. XPORK-15E]